MSIVENKSSYHLLGTPQELIEYVAAWQQEPVIAIDTEFMRTNTYFAKPGLIQVADSKGVYLIDPLLVTDLRPLSGLLENPKVTKIMHSMGEDVELLYYTTGARIENIFDTQIAAAFLGYGASLGYQKLVQEVLGIELDKSETRSDWLKRPLSESQMEYAAKDAEYLLELYEIMIKELDNKSLSTAVCEEGQFIVNQSSDLWENTENSYLRLRGGWDLSVDSQQLLKALVYWRDSLAKTNDIPKPWIFSDALLIQFAQSNLRSPSDLKRIKGIQFKSLRKYGDELLDVISHFSPTKDHEFRLIDKPVKGLELDTYQKIKKIVSDVSTESGIAVQLLGSRKMLEKVVIHVSRNGSVSLPAEYLGWRSRFLGAQISEALGI
jgi:ribonuclease D